MCLVVTLGALIPVVGESCGGGVGSWSFGLLYTTHFPSVRYPNHFSSRTDPEWVTSSLFSGHQLLQPNPRFS